MLAASFSPLPTAAVADRQCSADGHRLRGRLHHHRRGGPSRRPRAGCDWNSREGDRRTPAEATDAGGEGERGTESVRARTTARAIRTVTAATCTWSTPRGAAGTTTTTSPPRACAARAEGARMLRPRCRRHPRSRLRRHRHLLSPLRGCRLSHRWCRRTSSRQARKTGLCCTVCGIQRKCMPIRCLRRVRQPSRFSRSAKRSARRCPISSSAAARSA